MFLNSRNLFMGMMAIIGVIASCAMIISLIEGGFFNVLLIIAILMPLFFVLMVRTRAYWHVLILSTLTTNDLYIPIYGLNKLSIGFLVIMTIFGIGLFDVAMIKTREKRRYTAIDKMVLALAAIVTLRFLYDRPGLVAFGMETGGFMQSLYFVLALWFYFPVRSIVSKAYITRKQLWFITIVAFIVNLLLLRFVQTSEMTFWGRKIVNETAWMFFAMLLSLAATMQPSARKWFLFYGSFALFAVLGIISNYRSRVLFFMTEMLVVSHMVKCFKRSMAVLALCALIGLPLLIALGGGNIPMVARRALSIFITIEHSSLDARYSQGAIGWEDSGRAELYRLAWEKIKEHPIVGSGFGLKVKTALEILAVSRNSEMGMLALGGAYHNSLVALAVKSGVPSALLFSAITLLAVWRFYRWTVRSAGGDVKTLCIALLAFWFANTGMLLMNGGHQEFYVSVIVIALMVGLMNRNGAEEAPLNDEAKAIYQRRALPPWSGV